MKPTHVMPVLSYRVALLTESDKVSADSLAHGLDRGALE